MLTTSLEKDKSSKGAQHVIKINVHSCYSRPVLNYTRNKLSNSCMFCSLIILLVLDAQVNLNVFNTMEG